MEVGKYEFTVQSGHAIKFLGKMSILILLSFSPDGWDVSKHDVSVQIWTFHLIPRKIPFVN